MDPAAILARWLDAINRHDVAALTALMSPDHLFVDSLGNHIHGAAMETGWRAYFVLCPDYWIRTDHVMADNDTLLLSGEAGGTIDGNPWRTPAAWQATIRDGKLSEWRVFADNKPVYEILAQRRPEPRTAN